MAYDVYLGKMLLPITPPKIDMTIRNQNKTAVLINEGEVNLLKAAGLTDIQFPMLIPQTPLPFARQSAGFNTAESCLNYLESLKKNKEPFQFIVSRCLPSGKLLFDTNITVSLEDYKIAEDAKNGFDLEVTVNLKQYKHYSTKTVTLEAPSPTAPVVQQETRPPSTSGGNNNNNNNSSSSSGGGTKYNTVKLTVARGGSIDGGNCALSTKTAKPGQSVSVLPRARSGYAGDYFTYNGVKKTSSWSLTPTGKVGTIKILVYYKKKSTSTTSTVKKVASAVKTAATAIKTGVAAVVSKITAATKKTTTTVKKKAATSNKKVMSSAAKKIIAKLK